MTTIQYRGTSCQTYIFTNRYIPQWKINAVLYEADIRINYLSILSSECSSILNVHQHLVGLVFISYSLQFAILNRYHIVSTHSVCKSYRYGISNILHTFHSHKYEIFQKILSPAPFPVINLTTGNCILYVYHQAEISKMLTEFSMLMKLISLIKMCLNNTHSEVL